MMETVTVKIYNPQALKLLEDLEALNLIEVVRLPAKAAQSKKLSERLSGSISTAEANLMRQELSEMRNEWQRDI
jgi:hypothetical protein